MGPVDFLLSFIEAVLRVCLFFFERPHAVGGVGFISQKPAAAQSGPVPCASSRFLCWLIITFVGRYRLGSLLAPTGSPTPCLHSDTNLKSFSMGRIQTLMESLSRQHLAKEIAKSSGAVAPTVFAEKSKYYLSMISSNTGSVPTAQFFRSNQTILK